MGGGVESSTVLLQGAAKKTVHFGSTNSREKTIRP